MLKQWKWALVAGAGIIIAFCTSFAFFNQRQAQAVAKGPSNYALPEAILDQPLPKSRLVDQSGVAVDDDFLRQGKVLMVLLNPNCKACEKENAFLSTVVPMRPDVKPYGIVTLGEVPTLENPKGSPFQGIFMDGGFVLSQSLSVDRLPMTFFIENGIVKSAWLGAPNNDKRKAEFIEWFKHLG